MEQGLLAIRLLQLTMNGNSGSVEHLGQEELKDIKKAWQLSKKLLDADEISSLKNVLQHYAD